MILTGTPISAQEAKEYKIVSQVFPRATILEDALKLAHKIAQYSQLAAGAAKRSINASYETNLQAGNDHERSLFIGLLGSRVHAGSIIIIRPLLKNESKEQNDGFDYKLLIMKRSPNIVWGGFYAFSGGKVEEQDLFDNWEQQYPEMFKVMQRGFYDFNARICAKTFEEINMLIVKTLDGETPELYQGLREEYIKKYKSNFLEFCKDKRIIPDLNQVYGYRRVASGVQMIPGIDNQFYIYFAKADESVKKVDINKGEFTNAKWLNPKDALDKTLAIHGFNILISQVYYRGDLPMLVPQYLCLCHFNLIHNLSDFQNLAQNVYDSNLISYSSIQISVKNQFIKIFIEFSQNLDKLPKDFRQKAVKEFCNEHDLKSDKDRNMTVFANPNYAKLCERMASQKSSFKELADQNYNQFTILSLDDQFNFLYYQAVIILQDQYEGIMIGTMSGDFYDQNDGYPILSRKSSRRRMYMTKNWEVIRFEVTSDILELFIKHHIELPKL